jgi:hypothetical protein
MKFLFTYIGSLVMQHEYVGGVDKSLAFPICSTTKRIFFLDGLKKFE